MGILLTLPFIFFQQAVIKQGSSRGEGNQRDLKSSGECSNTHAWFSLSYNNTVIANLFLSSEILSTL